MCAGDFKRYFRERSKALSVEHESVFQGSDLMLNAMPLADQHRSRFDLAP